MKHSLPASSLLIIVGLISGLIPIIAFGSDYGPIDSGQPELAATIVLLISFGFVVTGLAWRRELSHYSVIPALTLEIVGVTSIGGSLIVFQPWEYAGLAGSLRMVITGLSIVVGGGLVLSGFKWFRQRELRYPLALLAGLLAVGLFYLIHQRFDFLIDIPVLAFIIVLVGLIPIVTVLSGLTPRSSK